MYYDNGASTVLSALMAVSAESPAILQNNGESQKNLDPGCIFRALYWDLIVHFKGEKLSEDKIYLEFFDSQCLSQV